MNACARAECVNQGKPTYCSRKCAGIVNAKKKPHAFFVAMGKKGRDVRRLHGSVALRAVDASLMRVGRYSEAARLIYDRGYSAGWLAAKRGHRQMPERRSA